MRARSVNESIEESNAIIENLRNENAQLLKKIQRLEKQIEFFQDTEAHGSFEDWHNRKNYGPRGDMDSRSYGDPEDWRGNEMGG